MFNIIALSLILAVPYVCYKIFLVPYFRNFQDFIENKLKKKYSKLRVFNKNLDLFLCFLIFKYILLTGCTYVFMVATKMFVYKFLYLSLFKMLVCFFVFGIPYFFFGFKLYFLLYKAFKKEKIYFDEIFDIYLFSVVIVIFCIFLDEISIYPSTHQCIKKNKL